MSSLTVVHGARQLKVKVTPSTLLREVKERACNTLELNPALYDLKSGKLTIDGALPVRLSNLVSNAKVELAFKKKKDKKSNVTIKLRVSDLPPDFSDSLQHEFGPATTIWAILRFFEKRSGINFTQRQITGGYYEMPSVQTFNSELRSLDELNQSLEDLGIVNGNAAFRVKFEKVPIKFEDAIEKQTSLNGEITLMEVDEGSKKVNQKPELTSQEEQDQEMQSEGHSQEDPNQQQDQEQNVETGHPIDRKPQAYVPSEAPREIPDDNNDQSSMNTAQFKLYRNQMINMSGSNRQDGPLMTKSMQEKIKQEKQLKTASCLIRVRLPDQTHIEGVFSPNETVGSLQEFVKSVLNDPTIPFVLFQTPPRKYLADPSHVLGRDLRFGAREVVFFEWDNNESQGVQGPKTNILKSTVLKQAKSIAESESIKIDQQQPAATQTSSSGSTASKVKKSFGGGKPSWLKLSKK